MILTIYIEDKICHYDKKKSSDIKETADIADALVITVKILIYRAEDYTLVMNTSTEDTSVIFSSLSTLSDDSTFYSF